MSYQQYNVFTRDITGSRLSVLSLFLSPLLSIYLYAKEKILFNYHSDSSSITPHCHHILYCPIFCKTSRLPFSLSVYQLEFAPARHQSSYYLFVALSNFYSAPDLLINASISIITSFTVSVSDLQHLTQNSQPGHFYRS